ncbi:MAG: hypothetical protein HY773_02240 [Candidatus Terrybacteria bacterium]|nr:hypothetical protein [Candidatus Terrybacteria bacterium]
MSILDKIENLQKKPEPVRKKILFISMAVIFFIVIVVWISIFKISLRPKGQNQADYAPFMVFKNLVKEGFDASAAGIKEVMEKIKQVISNQ